MRRMLVTTAVLIGLASAFSPSHAGLPSPLDVKRQIDRRIESDLRRLDLVPGRLIPDHRSALRPYFASNLYDRRHRHFHSVYRFPVRIGGRVVYRPYTYCDDALLLDVTIGLPVLAVQLYVPAVPARGIAYVRDTRDYRYANRDCRERWRQPGRGHACGVGRGRHDDHDGDDDD